MEDTTLFRTQRPEPVVEKQEDPKVDEPQLAPTTEKDDMPPSLYREVGKVPYILEMFESVDIYKQFDYESKTNEIDDFILSEVKRLELKDNKESYKKILDELYKHIKETDNIYSDIDNLLDWIRIQRKLIEVVKEKEAFEKKPIEEMSSRELKKLINSK